VSSQAQILVVDDEKTLRDIVGRALMKLGHRCVTASNGEEALALLARQTVDLVLTDLKMPKMGGLALIEWLRKEHPEIPVIIMTGYADLESARKALRLRVSDYLVKPFESLAEVQAAVQRSLGARTCRADTEVLVLEFEKRAQEFGRCERHLTHTLERAKVEIDGLARSLERSEAVAGCQVEQIDTMIENLENGILVTDAKGIVLSMNHELRRQLQAASSHGTGFSVDRLPGDGTLREAMIESQERLRMGIEEPVFTQTLDRSGEQCTYEVRAVALAGQDDVAAGILTIVRPARLKPAKSEAHAHHRAPGETEPPRDRTLGRRALVARWTS
jgi:CheY-like chemotaxis protein